MHNAKKSAATSPEPTEYVAGWAADLAAALEPNALELLVDDYADLAADPENDQISRAIAQNRADALLTAGITALFTRVDCSVTISVTGNSTPTNGGSHDTSPH